MKDNKIKFSCLCAANFLLLSFLIVMGGQNYSLDSYSITVEGYTSNSLWFVTCYRWMSGLLWHVMNMLGHNPITNSTPDICLFIVIVSVSLSVLAWKFYRSYGKKSLLSLIVIDISLLISVCNVWFGDILSFPECTFNAGVGVALVCCAVALLIDSQKPLNCVISSVCVIIATGIFQQFLFLFAIYIIAYCCIIITQKETNSLKEMLGVFAKPFLVFIVSGIIYAAIALGLVAALDLPGNSRTHISLTNVFDTIAYFIRKQHSWLKGRGFFRTEFLTVSYVFSVQLWLICLIRFAVKTKKFKKASVLACAVFVSYICMYAVSFISTYSTRAVFTLFSTFFLVGSGILSLTDRRFIKSSLAVLFALVFAANAFHIVEMENKLKALNDADENWAKAVLELVDEHERETGITIKAVSYYTDAKCDGNSTGVIYGEGSPLKHDFFQKYILNTFSGSNRFDTLPKDEAVYAEYFEGKDWDKLVPEEQLIFIGDTLHLCIY